MDDTEKMAVEKAHRDFMDARSEAAEILQRVIGAAAQCETKAREVHRGLDGPSSLLLECWRGRRYDPLYLKGQDVINCLPGWLAPYCRPEQFAVEQLVRVRFKPGELEAIWGQVLSYHRMVAGRSGTQITPRTLENPVIVPPGQERATPALGSVGQPTLDKPRFMYLPAGGTEYVEITPEGYPTVPAAGMPALKPEALVGINVTGIILDSSKPTKGLDYSKERIERLLEDLKSGAIVPAAKGIKPLKYWMDGEKLMVEFQITDATILKDPPTQLLSLEQLRSTLRVKK